MIFKSGYSQKQKVVIMNGDYGFAYASDWTVFFEVGFPMLF